MPSTIINPIYTIPSLFGWYSPNSSSLTVSGGEITDWKDSAIGSQTLVGGSAGSRPVYGGVAHSQAGAVFDGTDDVMSGTPTLITSAVTGTNKSFTIISVGYATDVTTTQALWGLGSSSDANPYYKCGFDGDTFFIAKSRDAGGGEDTINVGVPVDGQTYIVAVSIGGTTATLYVDGVNLASDTFTSGAQTLNTFALGSLSTNGSFVNKLAGGIGDTLFFDRELSSGTIGLVTRSLGNAYGIGI